MPRNKFKFTTGVIFIALLVGANILLIIPQEHSKKINYFFVKITTPFRNLMPKHNPSNNDTVSKASFDELLAKHENLQAGLEEILEKYKQLAMIRASLPKPGPAIVMANVTEITLDGQRNELVINKGTNDGLKKNQFVMSSKMDPIAGPVGSVLGRISELSPTMARVQLVTDASYDAKIEIRRKGIKQPIEARIKGKNAQQGFIPLVSKDIDIQQGDAVFAPRQSGYLETPIVIGTISKRQRDEQDPLLWDITVEPIIDVKGLTDIAVVIIDMETTSDDEDE